ncbi:MAG: DUF1858 domain-containing protein [Lachnospiraceae bacterium]|nr:DUF1858 domain-containing protein [Lachnospiraceae bacterium]
MSEENGKYGITKQTTMGDILLKDPDLSYLLTGAGMHCIGCYVAVGETLEEACMVHGLDPDDILEGINSLLESKEAAGA